MNLTLARTVPGGIPHRWKMHLWPPGMELRKGRVQGMFITKMA